MKPPIVHDFQESLQRSQYYAEEPWWFDVYRNAFPGMLSAPPIRNDGWAQRGGIDRVITLNSGRTITIDEKVREKEWPDILLERWSDEERKIPGWVQKPLACEFIAYAFVPSRTCYLLPTLLLQRAWRHNGEDWIKKYPEVRAQNNGWVTLSVAVPITVLLLAIAGAALVSWGEEEATVL